MEADLGREETVGVRRGPFSRRGKSGRQCGQRAAGLARFLPSAKMASPFWASLTCSWKARSRRGYANVRWLGGALAFAVILSAAHVDRSWTLEAEDAVTSVEPEPNVADHEAVPLIPQQALPGAEQGSDDEAMNWEE